MNPFLVKGYKSPKYFCDRKIETQTLIDAALNQRDLTLYSLRRMGKTGLIRNSAYYLKKKHKFLNVCNFNEKKCQTNGKKVVKNRQALDMAFCRCSCAMVKP